jgi:hypothetical protein
LGKLKIWDTNVKNPFNGGVEMTRGINGRDSKEFRSETVKMIVEGGEFAYEVSRRLSLPKSTLEN